jgi:uncharacterized radical SAM superfamily protein
MTTPFSFPQEVWKYSEKQLTALLNSGLLKPKSNAVRFYAPSFSYYKTQFFCSSTTDFPTISVTGTACALNCKHCGGKVLETMHPAMSPQKLLEVCREFKQRGARGCLISGGCLPDGSVPLEPFVDVLGQVKRELGLTIFVHSGVISRGTALSLKKAGVNAVLMDVIGSSETIRKVYNLSVAPKDYAQSLTSLDEAELPFVPHIIVGLNMGKLDGELEALKIVSHTKPAALVIIAFMPIRGTVMEKTSPPKPLDIAKVAAVARLMFPKTPLVLGCMRPKGSLRRETDVLALKAGVDGVAFPSEQAVTYVQNRGNKILFSPYCCAQIYVDFASGP